MKIIISNNVKYNISWRTAKNRGYYIMDNNKTSIYSALAANLLIALTKFIAESFTNSSSMISEGIHSTVDTANQLLILYGLRMEQQWRDY
ncbi:cation transporter [Sphingobacterium multivorum]|uniref:cation transporter n=1 Tax=Sphingobacterium multivorum TaxID=28454 RepID=UPI0028A24102|nr:cation transporter [Sphingobacterium multivorum]